MSKWTDKDLKLLRETIISTPRRDDAFEIVAKKTERNPGTVSAKFYALERAKKSDGKGTAKKKAAAAPVSRSANKFSTLQKMSLAELVEVADAVQTEFAKRRADFDKAAAIFKQAK